MMFNFIINIFIIKLYLIINYNEFIETNFR